MPVQLSSATARTMASPTASKTLGAGAGLISRSSRRKTRTYARGAPSRARAPREGTTATDGAGRNPAAARVSVAELARDRQLPLVALSHHEEGLGPALDDVHRPEGVRPGVELRAVDELAFVFTQARVVRPGAGAALGAGLEHLVLQPVLRDRNFRPLRILREVRSPGSGRRRRSCDAAQQRREPAGSSPHAAAKPTLKGSPLLRVF